MLAVEIIVPAALGGIAVLVVALVFITNAIKGNKTTTETAVPQARILVHAINDDRCVGCDACVAVCPTNVLDLVNNKSRVLRFQDCIQCEQCMWACPTDALVMHLEGTQPPPLKVPEIDEFFQTAVPGQYLIGEVAGKPLVKNAANLGRMVVEHMLSDGLRPGEGGDDVYDVAIVGSGPGGLSAALTCMRHGLKYVVLEKEQMIASTVSRYPKGKWVMAEPYDVRNLSFLPVFDSSKEEMVPIWQQLSDSLNVHIKMGEPVEEAKKDESEIFNIRTTVDSYRAKRLVLAIGTRGKPRTLGVPGENLPKIRSLLEDPDDFRGQAVLVIGGGDSALEAAMALSDAGARVVLSYRGRSFNRAQAKNKQAIESYGAQKKVKILYQSQVEKFDADTVTLNMADGQQKSYPNHAAFVLIGAEPPIRWLNKVGIEFVERPHSYALGKTDELILGMVGEQNALDCPEDASLAAALVRDGILPAAVQQQQMEAQASKTMVFGFQPASGPRGWLKSATTMFTQALRIDKPMSLSEFANSKSRRMHSGNGRRDALSASERTRVLRMLRDEGGRLADEDTQMVPGEDKSAAPPPQPAQTVVAFRNQPAPQEAAPQGQGYYQQGAPPPVANPPVNATHIAWQQQPPAHAAPTLHAAPPLNASAPPPGPSTVAWHPNDAAQAPDNAPQQRAHGSEPKAVEHQYLPFEDEPTRQVDGEVALSALLNSNGEAAASSDAAATIAMNTSDIDILPSSDGHGGHGHGGHGHGGHNLTIRGNQSYMHHGEVQPHQHVPRPDNVQIGDANEPTRSVDAHAWLRGQSSNEGSQSGGLPGPAQGQGLNSHELPTQAIDTSFLPPRKK